MPHFDSIASGYDLTFTHTEIGKRQRAAVYSVLEKILSDHQIKNVLELNCGTGEDAIFFAQKGLQVLATDISPEMVRVAAHKAEQKGVSHLVRTRVCAFQDLALLENDLRYDLIFSNFGGLNCLPPGDYPDFVQNVTRLLNPGGLFVAVVMPRFCLWETLYFLAKGKFRQAFRRLSREPVSARLDDSTSVKTWYYSPSDLKLNFKNRNLVDCRPIGFFIPPSYLEPFFKKRIAFLDRLAYLDSISSRYSILAGVADHFLVVFENKA